MSQIIFRDRSNTATGTATAVVTTITSPTAGSALSATAGTSSTQTMATFADTSDTNPGDYSATIDWGDGNETQGTITYSSGTFSVGGTYTYQSAGTFQPVVTITDVNGATQTISDPNATVGGMAGSGIDYNATQGDALSGIEVATFTDTGSGTYTATINWGDNTTSTGTISGSGGSYTVTASKSSGYTGSGEIPITVTISRSGQTLVIDDSNANVSTMSPTPETQDELQGETFSNVALATFTDTTSGSDYTADIDWGNGNESAGTITLSGSTYTITGGNTYMSSGTFNPVITLTNTTTGGMSEIKPTVDVAALATPSITSTSFDGFETLTVSWTASPVAASEFSVEALDDTDSGDNYFTLTYGTVTDEGSAGGGLENFTEVIPFSTYETGTNLPVGDVIQVRVVQATTGGMVVMSDASSDINLGATINDSVPNLDDVSTSDTGYGIQLSFTVPDSGAFPSGSLEGGDFYGDPEVIIQERNLDTPDPSFSLNPTTSGVGGLHGYPYIAPGDSGIAGLAYGDWQYEYRIATAAGDSPWSSPETVENDGPVAAPDVTVTENAGDPTTYNFSWSGDGNGSDQLVLFTAPGPTLQGYEPLAGGSITTFTGSGSISDVTINPGTYVAAYIVSGDYISETVGLTSILPFAASNLNAVAVSDSQINLTWNDNSSNDDSSLIYRATSDDFTQAKEIASVGADVNSYQDTSQAIQDGQAYTYWVVAKDETTTPSNPSTIKFQFQLNIDVDGKDFNIAGNTAATAPAVIIGETLEIDDNTADAPGALNVTFDSWDVQSNWIGSFQTTSYSGYPLPPDKPNGPYHILKFAYSTGSFNGTDEVIKYTYEINGIQQTIEGYVKVYEPTLTLTATQKEPTVGANEIADAITFTVTNFKIPKPFAGNLVWVQTLKIINSEYYSIIDPHWYVFPSETSFGLDNSYPYGHGNNNGTDDNPNQPLDPKLYSEFAQTTEFEMNLMFQPTSLLHIPVPLEMVGWYWSTDVIKDDTRNNRDQFVFLGNPDPDKEIQIIGKETIDYPTWSWVYINNEMSYNEYKG